MYEVSMASSVPEIPNHWLPLLPAAFHLKWRKERVQHFKPSNPVPQTLEERCMLWLSDGSAALRDTGFTSSELKTLITFMKETPLCLEAQRLLGSGHNTTVERALAAALMYLWGLNFDHLQSVTIQSASTCSIAGRVGLLQLRDALKSRGAGKWPCRAIRRQWIGLAGSVAPFSNILSRADGMVLNFANRRMCDYGHKGQGLNVLVVTNQLGHIVYYSIAEGSAHDLNMLKQAAPNFEPWLPGELMLADAGYVGSGNKHFPAMKRPQQLHSQSERDLNAVLGHIRASTETVHGRLKRRFECVMGNCRIANPVVLTDAAMALECLRTIWRQSVCPITIIMLQRSPISPRPRC